MAEQTAAVAPYPPLPLGVAEVAALPDGDLRSAPDLLR